MVSTAFITQSNILYMPKLQEKWWCHWSGSIGLNILTLADRKKIVRMKCLQASTGTTPLSPALRINVSSWRLMNTAGKERIKSFQMVGKLSIIQNHYLTMVYFRYMRFSQMVDEGVVPPWNIVPERKDGYPRAPLLPSCQVANDRVFLCRKLYDTRGRRMLKNPYWDYPDGKMILKWVNLVPSDCGQHLHLNSRV